MKTLAQVEPRTPIGPDTTPGDNDSTPSLYKITQPGSYYLTGPITGVADKIGIETAASNAAHGNTTNYSITGTGNTYGPIMGAGQIISSNPWANFQD